MVLRSMFGALLACLLASMLVAQEVIAPRAYKPLSAKASPELQTLLDHAVNETLEKFASTSLKREEVAATVIDLRDPSSIRMAEVRGNERIYPASVVKLFYLAAIERQIENGKVKVTPELSRGMHDMIVDSSNEATQYILDVITQTSSGAELPAKEFEAWQYKRNRVNRFFASLGYQNINVNQKTFCEDAYGIEQQSRHYKGENRNMLTTNATARLLAENVTGRIANEANTLQMMTLLKRDPFAQKSGDEDQAHDFTGTVLIDRKMTDAKLWSKAGWTSKTRHDAAYMETADGAKFVLVVFTENHANEKSIIPTIAAKVLDGLRK